MVKIISPVTQRQVEAEQIDFEAKTEPWSTYELTDGTTLKVRVILTGVLRIEGEYDQSGNPLRRLEPDRDPSKRAEKDPWNANRRGHATDPAVRRRA